MPPFCDPRDSARLKAIGRSTLPPIIDSYKFVCYNRDSSAIVVDMTKFFAGDNKPLAPIESSSGMVSITGKFKSEGSAIDQIKAFEDNVSVKSYLSYSVSADLLGLIQLKKDEPMTMKVTRTILFAAREAGAAPRGGFAHRHLPHRHVPVQRPEGSDRGFLGHQPLERAAL